MAHHDHAEIPAGHADHMQHLGHVLPYQTYFRVFLALGVFTVLTVVMAKLPFLHLPQPWNIIVAMLIASCKALLVALFFMHLKYENPITWLYAAFPIFLLFLMISGLFIDNPHRTHHQLSELEASAHQAIEQAEARGEAHH